METLAPFPYFGGKSKIAATVWEILGADIKNYIEPFAGSLAVLLSRPGGKGSIETVNDFDGLLANAWRAMAKDPEGVAHYADWPVNECDLHARHLWLVGNRENITSKLMADLEWFDAKAAGFWIWGACAWIGGGWCSGKGSWVNVNGQFVNQRKLPHVGDEVIGIKRVKPHVGGSGRGINRQLPHVGDGGRHDFIENWFLNLSVRLRDVRVACGDFERVLTNSVTVGCGTTGVFLDPPYEAGNTDPYAQSGKGVARRAAEWCAMNSAEPKLKIVLAGYSGEHNWLEVLGWTKKSWGAHGGYGSQGTGVGAANKHRETLWVSPSCQ